MQDITSVLGNRFDLLTHHNIGIAYQKSPILQNLYVSAIFVDCAYDVIECPHSEFVRATLSRFPLSSPDIYYEYR